MLMSIRTKPCILTGIEGKRMASQPLPSHKEKDMIDAAQRYEMVLSLLTLTADRKKIPITAALKDAAVWIEGAAGIGDNTPDPHFAQDDFTISVELRAICGGLPHPLGSAPRR